MTLQAYNEEAVRNLQLSDVATDLLNDGQLTPPQYEQVKTAFPVELKEPNLFVRIGLFIFTSLCIGFTLGLFGLVFASANIGQEGIGVLMLIFGIALIAVNQYFIRENNWYRQGSDNALSYAAISFFVVGICMLAHFEQAWTVALVSCVFLTLGTIHYGDPLLAFAAFYALCLSFFELLNLGFIHPMALPIAGFTLSMIVYFLSKTAAQNDALFYWTDCFTVLKIAALVMAYLSVNYYFVENSYSYKFPEQYLTAPYNIIFAVTTTVLPVVYLVVGIKNKDRSLWILGSLGIVASIMTYKYYHTVMPIEWALTLAGIALLALSIFLIKYLKTPRNGFVYLSKNNKNNLIESLVMNQILQNAAHSSTPESGTEFGGGNFDGGGAGGEFE
jgi:hypothetical protein